MSESASEVERETGTAPVAAPVPGARPGAQVRGRGGLWHHHGFRRLWIGESVSQFGSTISQLALPLVAILGLHASTFQVGVLAMCQTLAFAVVGLPVGAWVERMRFRRVLITNDVIRAVALGWVPLARSLGELTIWQLYLVALVTGVSTVFFDVAYMSYVPRLVDRDQLMEGNAKLQGSESVSQVAGPSVGGLLVQAITAPYAVLVDALSFLWSAGWIAAIKDETPRPERGVERHLLREIGEGLRFVLGSPLLRSLAICTGTANFFSSMGFAVFFVLLAKDLRLSPGSIGLISATSAVGGLIGAVVATKVAARLGKGPTIWISAALFGPCNLVAPFVRRDWTLGLLVVVQIVLWITLVVYNVTGASFRQALCPPVLLGRMNATMRFLVWGTLPLGSLIGGAVGSGIGVRRTLLVAGLGATTAFVPVFLSPLRNMREPPMRQA